jgi:hypothetical protein
MEKEKEVKETINWRKCSKGKLKKRSKRRRNKKFGEELMSCSPLVRHGLNRRWRVHKFFYCCVCIRCHSNVFTEPLSSNNKGIHIQTHTDGRYLWITPLRWASGAMIYIPSFIKIVLRIQKLMGGEGGHRHADREHGDLISLFLFFQNKGIRLKFHRCKDIVHAFSYMTHLDYFTLEMKLIVAP